MPKLPARARLSPRQCRVVELRYFGGLTIEETAIMRQHPIYAYQLQRELKRRLERTSNVHVDSARREESISRLKRRMSRLLDAYENDWIDKTEFESRMSQVKQHLERALEVAAQQERETQEDADLHSIVDQFQVFAQQIANGLENADLATQRKLLRLLVKRIDVDKQEVRVVYKVQSHPFVLSPNRGTFLQDCLKSHPAPLGLTLLSWRSGTVILIRRSVRRFTPPPPAAPCEGGERPAS